MDALANERARAMLALALALACNNSESLEAVKTAIDILPGSEYNHIR
jgi:hypothetical protein